MVRCTRRQGYSEQARILEAVRQGSFNAPIYANLFDDEDGEGHNPIWSRGRKPNGD